MNYKTLKPVALIGAEAKQIIEKLYALEPRFLPLLVPEQSELSAVLAGLEPLGFLGAIITGKAQQEALKLMGRKTQAAERDGGVDALTAMGGTQGTSTLEDALLGALDASGFQAFGAHAVIVGGGARALAATQLARAGFKTISVAANDRPSAEKTVKAMPKGVYTDALAVNDSRFQDVLERADVLVLTGDVRLAPKLLQPWHTLLEAGGDSNLSRTLEQAGGQVISYASVQAHHLAAQLEYVTGLKFDAASLA